jgi:diaminohydroxyphosphoribosylaminopyrimidine deaminase / 5-amino-6-(5-phosphoribosylamino)uracil reductase
VSRDASADAALMRRAIALARARLGATGDNPAVGCVIARNGRVVAEAATAPGGRPHAEEQALALAGEAARGASAFVSLEPCAERSSGAPSCAERLAAAGVSRVVFACANDHPLSAGGGPARLRAAGVAVEAGLLADEARPLYAGGEGAA